MENWIEKRKIKRVEGFRGFKGDFSAILIFFVIFLFLIVLNKKNFIKMSMFLYGSFFGLFFKLTVNKIMLKPFSAGKFMSKIKIRTLEVPIDYVWIRNGLLVLGKF